MLTKSHNQRANIHNSNGNPPHGNNKDYLGKINNRSNQLNPNNPQHQSKKIDNGSYGSKL